MGSFLKWVVSQTLETAPKLAFQVVASIMATICAASITSHYKPDARPVEPASQAEMVVDTKAAGHLFAATFTEDGFRLRPTYPAEFAAVYGIGSGKAYTALGAAEWSTPLVGTTLAHEIFPGEAHAPAATEVKPDKKPTMVAQSCSADCGKRHAAVVPPPRPAVLVNMADAKPTAQAAPTDKPVRLLGVELPGFVPSRDTIARTVVSWGDTIAGVIPGL